MLTANLLLAAVFGGAAMFPAQAPKRDVPVYVVAWVAEQQASASQRAMVEQVDRELREELGRRGVVVSGNDAVAGAIVLVPHLEILPDAVKLSLVEVSFPGRAVVGSVSAKVSGSGRTPQLRALINRAVDEADQL